MDDYIAAISGVQLTLVGALLGMVTGGRSSLGLVGASLVLIGSLIVGTVAYDDLTSR